MRFSSSAVARTRATCRINGNNFPFIVLSSSLQRAETPTASLFVVVVAFLFPPGTRFDFSGADRPLVQLRLLPALADRSASCQPRARQTPEQVPRGVEEK